MGNFSRDPKTRIGDSIAKHYVAILLQQGVPITDSDSNEAQDLRRRQHETLGARFIGSGVPAGDDGFRITAGANDNDFSIRRGTLLVNGKAVVNDADVSYTTQSNASLASSLGTPGVDTTLILYLETWEREVDSQEDPDLVDTRIGVETCLRLKREWLVQVVPGANPQSLPAPVAGHDIYPLAIVKRPANNPKITFGMIRELRRLHLTLADGTKAPLELYGASGNLIFTLQNFAEMLDITERAYFDILRSDLFMMQNFGAATPMEVATLSAVFNEVMQSALAASLQAKIRNLSNEDGLGVLQGMYNVQDHFVDVITPMTGVPARATTATLMTRLRQLLDGAPGVPGLQPAAFVNSDLDAAIKAQQEINRELGNRTQILPHGLLEIRFVSGPAAGTNIIAGGTFRYQYNVTYKRTIPGPAQEEVFDVLPALDPPGWTATIVGNPQNRITLHTEETTAVQVDVTIPPVPPVNSSNVKLQVRSRLNPTEMNTTNSEVIVTIGGGIPQPKVLHIQLLSPAMNLDTDTLSVGKGGPTGLPGKAKSLTFEFTYDETVGAPVDFTASFIFAPPNTFENIANATIQLGGSQPKTKQSTFNAIATTPSINGTTGTLTVRLVKASDITVSAEPVVIKLQVQKS